MIDPVNSLDKAVVVAATVEIEDTLVYIIAHFSVRTFANHFRNLIPLYQSELAQ